MWPIRVVKATVFPILAALLVVSSFVPSLLDAKPAVAQDTDCGATGDTIELKYDDGMPYAQMSDQYGLCDQCTTFQGVKFSLAPGTSASALRRVRFYAGGGKAVVRIHIMDVDLNYLTPYIDYTVSEEKWHDIPLQDVTVPEQFWVFLQRSSKKVMPFYDIDRTGPSNCGASPRSLEVENYKRPHGDLLIRAYVVPEAHVGSGQDYATVQEAVDSVWDGWRIIVHEGTYGGEVTVNKSLTIKSYAGPAKTIVQTSSEHPDSNAFRITASCVTLSGFTIQGADHAGRAGIYVDASSGCVISGNVVQDNNYGIYVSEGSESNILLENECASNTYGIYIDGSENYISGNHLHGNTAPVGSSVYLSAFGSRNQLRFNTITVDLGTDPAVAASAQVHNQSSTEEVSAIENWWGTDTGPSNAGGQGPLVGEGVRYDPWLGKQPVRVKTGAARAGAYTVDSRSETSVVVIKEGPGSAFVSVASFDDNPVGEFRYKTVDKWIDVLFSSSKSIDGVQIRVYYSADELAASGLKETSLRLFWWNGEKWQKCSKTGVDKNNDFVWAQLNLKSKPVPSDLSGTMFAVGVPKGSFAWWLIPVIILVVLLLLIVVRLVWVLVARRGGGYTSMD